MPVYAEKELVDGQRRYYIRTYVKDEFGKTKQITRHNKNWIGRDGKKEAEWEESRLKNGYEDIFKDNKKETNDIENITFEQLVKLKFEYDELHNNNSESSRITYIEALNMHIFKFIGHKNIYDLNKKDFDLITNHLKNYKSATGKNKGKNLSYKYINEIIHLIRSILKYGIEFYNLNNSILLLIPDVQQNKDEVKKTNYYDLIKKQTTISPEDWQKITKAMEYMIKKAPVKKKDFTKRMMLFLTVEYILLTRVGETQAMKYSNILFDLKIYNLYEAYNKRLKRITPTKNRKSRILYIPPTLYKLLKKIYREDCSKEGFNPEQFIFGNNKVFPRTTIDRYRTKLCKLAGIDYLTNHELRHAGISNAVYNGIDISALSDMAGHDKEIMLKIYVQTLNKSNSMLINTLDKISIPNI